MDSKSKGSDTGVSRRTVLTGAGALGGTAVLGGITAAGGGTNSNDDSNSESGAEGADESADPITIAHRGFGGLYPENTIAAMRGAVQADADAVEIDLMPCADGTPVVFHDPELSGRASGGLTDAKGVVWETDCGVVDSAEVRESNQTIPTLDELMDVIPSDVGITLEFKNPGTMDLLANQDIELKNPGSSEMVTSEDFEGETLATQKDLWRSFTGRALDTASQYDNEIIVSSFSEAAIAVTREYDSSIPVAYLFWDSIERGLEITREYDCEAIHPPYDMIQGTPFFNDGAYLGEPNYSDIDLVEVAHQGGREVNVYTLDTWYQAEQLAAAGVDGLINNYPGLLNASDTQNGDN